MPGVKKPYLIGLVVLLIGLGWMSLMAYVNSRTTALEVRVSGKLDEVRFYREAYSDQSVASIVTHGQDVAAVVELVNSADAPLFRQGEPTLYYFEVVKGGSALRGRTICCSTGFANKRAYLTIRDARDWDLYIPER